MKLPTLDTVGVPVRIGGFVLALALVFGAATGVGAAVGPIGSGETPSVQHTTGHTP